MVYRSGTAHSSSDHDRSAPTRLGRRLRLLYVVPVVLLTTIVVLTGVSWWLVRDVHLPSAAELTSRRVIVLKSADGRELLRNGHLKLELLNERDMPEAVTNAVLSVEGRQFYRNVCSYQT